MARLGSIAIGGYYPTPSHLIPRISPLLSPYCGEGSISFLDPCAGKGEAVLSLIKALDKGKDSSLYACEMETTRFEELKKACEEVNYRLAKNLVGGDAFQVSFRPTGGVSILFLNPPYDTDRVYGRLEHKFLTRFSSALMDDGILLFLVPFYALKTSAEFIGTEYTNVHCFKFPNEDFETFKQVVLYARKTETRLSPDQTIVNQVEAWAKDASGLPELPHIASFPIGEIPSLDRYTSELEEWVFRPVDMLSLAKKIRPWVTSKNGAYTPVRGVLPEIPIQELLLRKYPVATPPRPAHIAAGVAAGIFNGSRVEPTDPSTKLPSLLVKGVFDKEYKTIEEKKNKDGVVTSVVQVQQPKLVTTVLDLQTYRYHTLLPGDNNNPVIEEMTVAGLLKHYGNSLMAVMEQQCPILYDPRKDGDSVPLTSTDRRLFTAQGHAAKAIVKLLGGPTASKKERQGTSAILLGEIGSGKSCVSLSAALTIGSKRPLILCPPHLLTSWRNEIAAVSSKVDVRVLHSISDLESVASDTSDQVIVSLLSRETAKLSHSWEGAGKICPKCGAPTPHEDLAKKRSKCQARKLVGSGSIANIVIKLANQLMRFDPQDSTIFGLLQERWDCKRIAFYKKKRNTNPINFPGFVPTYFDVVLEDLISDFDGESTPKAKAIVWILQSLGDQNRIAKVAERFLSMSSYSGSDFGRQLLFMLEPNGQLQTDLVEKYQKGASNHWGVWYGFNDSVKCTQKDDSHIRVGGLSLSWADNILKIGDGVKPRSLQAAKATLNILAHISNLHWSEPCGEILYQAIPKPRRVALAKYIQRKYPSLFDFLIIDECHEYSSAGAAQEISAHRLTGLKIPTILMTGSIMNGYAESLFMNMWSVSTAFRQEFKREDKQRFNDRYGYRKRVISDKDEEGKVIEFGSMTDRVTRSEHIVGNAPGVLPLFLLRHLLPVSVTLHKADLALDLPPCRQEKYLIDPETELYGRFKGLQTALVNQIKRDRFDPELAGKLFGQLAELPSYLDRATADTGNNDSGNYEIRYPESVGSEIVASQDPLDSSVLLPKEQWLLEVVQKEISEGRNVMVFSWHVTLLPRLARLISIAIGEKVPILYANKVPTAKRQDWITNQIVKKGARVMVTNPVAIQTGLNNLIHFATEVWMELPACNPITFRQAIGRIDRIGQTVETRIMCPLYAGTLQEQLYDLLLHKVAVSIATDGLDPESALIAAGVGTDEFLTGLSIGKQLWAMLSEGVIPSSEKRYKPKSQVSSPMSIFDLMDNVSA